VLNVFAPVLFVLIWSTGFIVARAIDGVADPNLFLLVRFLASVLLFAGLALALRVTWPARATWPKHVLAGALLQGVYVGGGYWAVSHGLSPAVMALLGTLQPMVTALIAQRLFDEPVGRSFWAGLATGAVGVLLVLSPRLSAVDGDGLSALVIVVALLSVTAITAGTLIQKTSLAGADLISASAVQYTGGAAVVGLAAWLFGGSEGGYVWQPGAALWGALAWSVFALSGVATTLLVWMVRRGSAAKVTVLLLLAPPLAAVQAWWLFDARLTVVQIVGFALALGGVLLCRRPAT